MQLFKYVQIGKQKYIW